MSKKRTKTNDTPEYSIDDRVIIFGGVVDTDGIIESSIQQATVLKRSEEDDLLVSNGGNFSSHDDSSQEIFMHPA